MPTASKVKSTHAPREKESALVLQLRRLDPAAVRVMNGDDEREVVAVPTRRRKWASVVEAIEARSWSSCVALDKSGKTLGHIENTSGASELQDIGNPVAYAGLAGQVTLAERIVGIAMAASERTLRHRDAEVAELLKAQGQVVQQMSAGMSALSDVFRAQVEAAQDAADARVEMVSAEAQAAAAAASAESGGDWKQLLEALPIIMQALPMLKQIAGGAPTVANGVNKH